MLATRIRFLLRRHLQVAYVSGRWREREDRELSVIRSEVRVLAVVHRSSGCKVSAIAQRTAGACSGIWNDEHDCGPSRGEPSTRRLDAPAARAWSAISHSSATRIKSSAPLDAATDSDGRREGRMTERVAAPIIEQIRSESVQNARAQNTERACATTCANTGSRTARDATRTCEHTGGEIPRNLRSGSEGMTRSSLNAVGQQAAPGARGILRHMHTCPLSAELANTPPSGDTVSLSGRFS